MQLQESLVVDGCVSFKQVAATLNEAKRLQYLQV
jgi:hypothetical protein